MGQAIDEKDQLRAELHSAQCQQLLKELDVKVSRSIAPLLQCVTLEQMELKAKLTALEASLPFEEINKVNCVVVPMLQSMALQQMDLKKQLDSLQLGSVDCRSCEKMADFLENTRKELSSMQAYSVKVEELEALAK